MNTELDVITIKGLSVRAQHGVLPFEHKISQPFNADISLWVSTREAANSDDISETVSYSDIADEAVNILSGPHVALLETLAEKIASAVLAYPGVHGVEVTIHKPYAPIDHVFSDVSVTIRRGEAVKTLSPSMDHKRASIEPQFIEKHVSHALPTRAETRSAKNETALKNEETQVINPVKKIESPIGNATEQRSEKTISTEENDGAYAVKDSLVPVKNKGDSSTLEAELLQRRVASPLPLRRRPIPQLAATDSNTPQSLESSPAALSSIHSPLFDSLVNKGHIGTPRSAQLSRVHVPSSSLKDASVPADQQAQPVASDLPSAKENSASASSANGEQSESFTRPRPPIMKRAQKRSPYAPNSKNATVMRHSYVLALGGNIGDVPVTIAQAIYALSSLGTLVINEVSPMLRSRAVLAPGQEPQDDYWNVVLMGTTSLTPHALLEQTQIIEKSLGRSNKSGWLPRTIDIDIIDFDHMPVNMPDLTLPHPRAHERAFVLLPWRLIDPDGILIGYGKIYDMADKAPDAGGVLDVIGNWWENPNAVRADSDEMLLRSTTARANSQVASPRATATPIAGENYFQQQPNSTEASAPSSNTITGNTPSDGLPNWTFNDQENYRVIDIDANAYNAPAQPEPQAYEPPTLKKRPSELRVKWKTLRRSPTSSEQNVDSMQNDRIRSSQSQVSQGYSEDTHTADEIFQSGIRRGVVVRPTVTGEHQILPNQLRE